MTRRTIVPVVPDVPVVPGVPGVPGIPGVPVRGASLISTVLRLLVAAYFIEAGIVLVVAPWTAIWDRNFFALTQPWLGAIMANGLVRGGVSGVGVVTAFAGLRDLTAAILRRPSPQTPEAPPPAS